MSSTYNPGRVAGFWYLLLIAIGPFFLIYIPSRLRKNEGATYNAVQVWRLCN